MQSHLAAILKVLLNPVVAIGGALIIAAVAVGFALQMGSVTPSGQYTAAVVAPITAVGGASSDLSFQVSGQVVAILVAIGQQVSAGTALVVLDHSSLLATRAGAVANFEAAQARLAALQAGTRPEQLAVNQNTVTQGQESLRDAVRSAYINADDAIHNKVDQFFINPRTSGAAMAFTVPDQTLQNLIEVKRVELETPIKTWGAKVNDLAFATSDPLADAKVAQANLAQIAAFLDSVATALAKNPTSSSSTMSPAMLQGYQASVNTARLNVSGSVSAVTGATTALVGAQGALTLALSGATLHDIAAAQAVVDAAQAALAGIDVTLRQSTLTAPMNGTVTVLNAHLGQTVSPGQIIASIKSSGGSKSDALVIPKSSVITDASQSFVYVKSAKGAPTKTFVTIGLMNENMAEITSGLTAGQEVLTFGTTSK